MKTLNLKDQHDTTMVTSKTGKTSRKETNTFEPLDSTVEHNLDKEAAERYNNSIKPFGPLSIEEEIRLYKELVAGDFSAAWKLALSMAAYILGIARRYCNGALMRSDICQEAFCGLAIATKKFNPAIARYSTFASWWIHKFMSESFERYGHSVTLPRECCYLGRKVQKAISKFENKYGDKPSVEELAAETGMSIKDIMIGMDEGCYIVPWEDWHDNMVKDDFDLAMDRKEELVWLNKAMACLDVRTHDILCLKYGLEGCEQMKVKDIAKLFDISEERVRQLEKAGLKKLKLHLGPFGYAQ